MIVVLDLLHDGHCLIDPADYNVGRRFTGKYNTACCAIFQHLEGICNGYP